MRKFEELDAAEREQVLTRLWELHDITEYLKNSDVDLGFDRAGIYVTAAQAYIRTARTAKQIEDER